MLQALFAPSLHAGDDTAPALSAFECWRSKSHLRGTGIGYSVMRYSLISESMVGYTLIGTLNPTGASLAIDDCYELWESGFISIPFSFQVSSAQGVGSRVQGVGRKGSPLLQCCKSYSTGALIQRSHTSGCAACERGVPSNPLLRMVLLKCRVCYSNAAYVLDRSRY